MNLNLVKVFNISDQCKVHGAMKVVVSKFWQIITSVLLLTNMLGAAHADEAGHAVFVSGKVEMAGKAIVLNSAIVEGAELNTGADGYLYIKTVDNGFFILRPNTRARIAAYHIDHTNPANTRIKLELLDGVARSISGEAVKLARQNFRFNTPVAAIGVRGTDFVVYTTQETSRVTVISGGIVVSGFASGCSPQGFGPCEGNTSAELFAKQQGQLMQISKDQAKPQLLPSNGSAPDVIAPPRPDEPSGKVGGNVSGSNANGNNGAGLSNQTVTAVTNPANVANGTPSTGSNSGSSTDILDAQRIEELRRAIVNVPLPVTAPPTPPVPPPVVPEPNQIIWGRWATVAGQAPTIDITQHLKSDTVIRIDNYFALFQLKDAQWSAPQSGVWGFALSDSEAYITNQVNNVVSVAKVQNATLNIDFTNSSFVTNFDLLSGSDVFKRRAEGRVYADGQFANEDRVFSNTVVNGVLSNQNGGAAAYTFQSRIDDNRVANGITIWGRSK